MKKSHLLLSILFLICIVSCNKNDSSEEISIKKKVPPGSVSESQNDQSGFSSDKNDNSLKVITSKEVRKHIGDSLKVKGYVADIYLGEKVAYLNFENKFPKNDFSCAIFSGRFDEFGDLSTYKNKTVEVTGKISTYKGKPQIILNSKDQLKILLNE